MEESSCIESFGVIMSEKLKILIVDDNQVNLTLLEKLLVNEDAHIFLTYSGSQAIELVSENDFALILLDVQMPGMDGYETAREIKKNPNGKLVPIIFLTAIYKDPEYARMGYDAGAVDFLTQPIDPPTLRSKVGVFLELKRQKDLLEQEIKQRKRTEQALRVAEEKYRNIFYRAVEGIFRSTLEGVFVEANPAFARILGFDSVAELVEYTAEGGSFMDPNERSFYIERLKRDRSLNDYEIRATTKNGTKIWVSESSRLFEEDGDFYIEGVVEDITQRKMSEIQLQEKATVDALTGIPNRYLFFDRLENSIENAKRYKNELALLFIDLDDFKSVNDEYGHQAGDILLSSVACRLKTRLRSSDTLARLGGDEFCVLLERPLDRESVAKVAQDFISCLTEPFSFSGIKCQIGATIGISLFPEDASSPQDLVRKADEAMYMVKGDNKRRFAFCYNGICKML